MKNIILIIVALVSFHFGFGQDKKGEIQLKVTSAVNKKNTEKFMNIVFSVSDINGGSFIGQSYKKGYIIEHLDKNLKLIKSYDLVSKRPSQIEHAFIKDEKLILLQKAFNNESEKVEINALISSIDEFSFKKKNLKSIDYKELKIKREVKKREQPSSFGFFEKFMSSNNNYFVFIFWLDPHYKVIEFDDNLNEIFDKRLKNEIKMVSPSHNLVLTDNLKIAINEKDGSVFYLQRKSKNTFLLQKINSNRRIDIKIQSQKTVELLISSKDDKIYCAGLYRSKKDLGSVFFSIDANKMTIISSKISSFAGIKGITMPTWLNSMTDFPRYLKKVMISDDNNCYIITEEYSVTQSNSNVDRKFGDIIVTKLNDKGELVWAKNISKIRVASGFTDENNSFFALIRDNKFYLFFNARVREKDNNDVYFYGKIPNYLCGLSFDKSGNFLYQEILKPNYIIQTRNGIKLNSDEIMFYERRKKKYRYTRIKF